MYCILQHEKPDHTLSGLASRKVEPKITHVEKVIKEGLFCAICATFHNIDLLCTSLVCQLKHSTDAPMNDL